MNNKTVYLMQFADDRGLKTLSIQLMQETSIEKVFLWLYNNDELRDSELPENHDPDNVYVYGRYMEFMISTDAHLIAQMFEAFVDEDSDKLYEICDRYNIAETPIEV